MEENKVQSLQARCPSCGADLTVESTDKMVKCPSCGAESPASMAIKYYESLHENKQEVKEAHGEDYQKLNMVLDELYGLLAMCEYEKAEEKYYEATMYSETDYRVYMAMVAVKTKNYTDLKDQEHKQYINKAIAYADAEAKQEIVRIYKPYYHKANLSEEELLEYTAEENKIKKTRLEKTLKNMIPVYMAKEKRNKVFLILFPILLVLGIGAVVFAAFIDEIKWISIIGAIVTIAGYIIFRSWFLNRDKIKSFNALLDFYDFVDARKYSDQVNGNLYTHMQSHADKFADDAPSVSISDDTVKLIDYLIILNDGEMNKFILANKYFSQFVSEE